MGWHLINFMLLFGFFLFGCMTVFCIMNYQARKLDNSENPVEDYLYYYRIFKQMEIGAVRSWILENTK